MTPNTSISLGRSARGRSAFTLIELLIVIFIIAILAALTASATFRLIGVTEEKTTQQNLMKLYNLLDQHWKAVIAKANSDPVIPNMAMMMAGSMPPNPNLKNIPQRARVIHIKLSLRQHFPVTQGELTNPPLFGNDYQTLPIFLPLKDLTVKLSIEQQSAALLYLSLKQARSGVTTDADAVFTPSETIPAVNTFPGGPAIPDVKCIVDAWQNPIVFSRWPTGDPELNPGGVPRPAPPWLDPDDPNGYLSDPLWATPSNMVYVNFANFLHLTGNGTSFKLQPVLMSWGSDKAHGLQTSGSTGAKDFTSLQVINQTEANDNIYTYRLRVGGSGN